MLLMLLVPSLALPAGTPATPTAREAHLAQVLAHDAEHSRQYGANPLFLVRPGLLADRSNHIVRLEAESIRLQPGDPVEFPLITQGSGKDYESLAVALASALDIREALQFIGLTPGHGVEPSELRFWPRGDRVRVLYHFATPIPTNAPLQHVPVERLIRDTRTGKPLPECGFTFTGSEWLPALEPATGKVFAADAFSPGSILSVYNDGSTLLDVPRRATQNDVYTYQVPNPEYTLPSNQLITVTLEPFYPDALPHALDLTLRVAPGTGPQAGLSFALFNDQGQALNTNRSANGFLTTLESLARPDRELHLTFITDDALPVADLSKAARVAGTLDSEHGARIAPPAEGHPYFKSFLPDERYRTRVDRPSQTTELHLGQVAGAATATVTWVTLEWKAETDVATATATNEPAASPEVLAGMLEKRAELPPVMLVFAPGVMPYGMVRPYLAPLVKRHLIVYLFQE